MIKINKIFNSVIINLMINKINKSKSRLEKYLMDGMMNSSILVMTINSKKLSNKKQEIKFNNSSKSRKIKIGGERSEINLI